MTESLFFMTDQSRRNFIEQATVLGAGALVTTNPHSFTLQSKVLLHHVFFWLKQPGSETDRKKLVEGLLTLKAISTIKQLHIGYPASTEKREVVDNSWDVSELMFFDDLAGQKVYQDHPIHQAFIQNYSHLWVKVIVYDAMDVI
ncbi:MAG: Dabb family protein [Bacteroidota bacterium]